jgi:hypothetical protein
MCKHQLKQQFLAKKAEAELVNSLPDNQDMQIVTGLSLEDFGTAEAAKDAYEMGMEILFQKGNQFALRSCALFPNLNFKRNFIQQLFSQD